MTLQAGTDTVARDQPGAAWRRDLALVLRRYGFLGLDGDNDGAPITRDLRLVHASLGTLQFSRDTCSIVLADGPAMGPLHGLDARAEPGGSFLYTVPRFSFLGRKTAYRPLLPYMSFYGEGLTSIWTTKCGRTVVGWWDQGGRRHLLVGLRVVEEIVRNTQGDPRKVLTAQDKTLWGAGHERPAYLFEDNIVQGQETVPWADRLGYLLAHLLAKAGGLPLLAPLPAGAHGAVMLTGDDDQAFLEKYDEQLRLLNGFPITYCMLPHTRHSAETLARMPNNVEFGVHIDALPAPAAYDRICEEQTEAVRRLVGRRARVVRNHGHLNNGYWGHLRAWEQCELTLDLNVRGLDGTCPTGSYLPFRVRRPDGSWSSHVSLFSTFSDSMLYLQKWPQPKQIACFTQLARQIERSDPGILVFNLHPQNVGDVADVHRAVVALGRRRGWLALGAESHLDWLTTVEGIRLRATQQGFELQSPVSVDRLAYTWPGATRKKQTPRVLPRWRGSVSL